MAGQGVRDLVTVAATVGLLGLVAFLPPDTSYSEVRSIGLLKICAPASYPPLVTGDPTRPGLDIELLTAVAERLGLRVLINTNPAIGRDFNPRAWRVTRAQCQVIAGGVITSPQTRSFMETVLPHAETGWVALSVTPLPDLAGKRVAVLPGVSGLDRVALSSYLRSAGATVSIARDRAAVAADLTSGAIEAAVTESLLAATLAQGRELVTTELPEALGRYDVAFGLWKGDLTLKRAMTSAYAALEREGVVATIRGRYLGTSAEPSTPAI